MAQPRAPRSAAHPRHGQRRIRKRGQRRSGRHSSGHPGAVDGRIRAAASGASRGAASGATSGATTGACEGAARGASEAHRAERRATPPLGASGVATSPHPAAHSVVRTGAPAAPPRRGRGLELTCRPFGFGGGADAGAARGSGGPRSAEVRRPACSAGSGGDRARGDTFTNTAASSLVTRHGRLLDYDPIFITRGNTCPQG
jgi:hypothetical protein